MDTTEARLAARLAAAARPFVPRAERAGRRPLREIACRRCGLMTYFTDDDGWVHEHDHTPACIQPEQVWANAELDTRTNSC